MKTGLVSITFRKLSVEEIVKLVSEAKLEGIEWGGDVHVPHGDLRRAEEVSRITKEAGLAISAYGSYYRFDDCLSSSEEYELKWDAVLDTACALGAPVIRVWAGRHASNAVSETLRARMVHRAQEIAEQAEGRGIRIGFELHEDTLTDSSASTESLLTAVGRDNVFTFWQPYMSVEHSNRMEGLKSLIDRIGNVHCNHFAKEGWPHALPLKEGERPWADFLEVLTHNGADRWISIEHVQDGSVESFQADAEVLRRWIRD